MSGVLVCQFCGERVFVSRQDYRTKHFQKNGVWTSITYHTACDPFIVKTTVTPR